MHVAQNLVTDTLNVQGMTCASCERRLEEALSRVSGVVKAKASYSRSTVQVRYDSDRTTLDQLTDAIEAAGYQVAVPAAPGQRKGQGQGQAGSHRTLSDALGIERVRGVLSILVALYIAFTHLGLPGLANVFPEAEAGMSYGMLFVIGLLTSVHCIAMCGGINLSQCVPLHTEAGAGARGAVLRRSLLYNLGRVISYTVVGAVVGALGSVVSFSGAARGIVQIVAGIFMVIMGLNMLNLFPWLRRLAPRMPRAVATRAAATAAAARAATGKPAVSNAPLYVGLLNGLMPCGPLQAMQLYALSTGDPMKGAFAMFVFSLGTVPLMFSLGVLTSVLNKKFAGKMMAASAALVVVLGVFMFSSGMSLSGIAVALPGRMTPGAGPRGAAVAQVVNGVQVVSTPLAPGSYQPIRVQAGIPVRWTIVAQPGTLNGCNNRIIIPEYGIERRLELGENVIEFVPTQAGTVPFACWMGMIRSSITVMGVGAGS